MRLGLVGFFPLKPTYATQQGATKRNSKARTWLDRLPCSNEEPCEAVATAPPTVWSMNQQKLPKV